MRERRYLTHAQLDALAEACGGYRLLVLVLGYCGLRFGEATALSCDGPETDPAHRHRSALTKDGR
jgi:integrase